MGRSYKCDRCGNHDTAEPESRLEDYHGGFGSKPIAAQRDEKWLCGDCYEKFNEFMEGK
jgi:transposase-like protein